MSTDNTDWLSMPELAQMAGITPATLRKYRQKGQNGLPAPDGYAREKGRAKPLWSRRSAESWLARRGIKAPEDLDELPSVEPKVCKVCGKTTYRKLSRGRCPECAKLVNTG